MKNIIYIFIIAAIFTACNISVKTEKNALNKEIAKTEQVLFDSISYNLDIKKAELLISKYNRYAKLYDNDSLAPIYLIKSADLCIATKKYEKAVEIYDNIYKNYNSFEKAPQALFLEAMTYADYLKNESVAEMKYKEFIKKYPNHELTDDAKKSIEFLGKTPKEILEILQSKDTIKNN